VTPLEQALGALVRRDGGRLVASPRSSRELAELFAALVDQRAVLGRDVHLERAGLGGLGPVDERSMTIDCGAGVPVRDVEALAAEHRLTLGALPPSAWALEVGALVEHPAFAFRPAVPGRLEPLASIVVAVLAGGQVISSGPGPWGGGGPGLEALVVGGGGAVGLVTRATLRLGPGGEEARRRWSFERPGPALEGLKVALAAGVGPARAVLRPRNGRVFVEVTLRASPPLVSRDAALLARCLERGGGRFEGAGQEGEVDGAEREATWGEVAEALERGAPLELFRISLDAVVARGLAVAARPPERTQVSTLFDPSSILGGPR
jgi:FAD/FMN-containing dehydrogenase